MRYYICAVYDMAVEAFSRPMFVRASGEALRSFKDEVQRSDPGNPLFKHPGDYSLYELGTWTDDDCGFTLLAKPERIARGSDFAVQTEE